MQRNKWTGNAQTDRMRTKPIGQFPSALTQPTMHLWAVFSLALWPAQHASLMQCRHPPCPADRSHCLLITHYSSNHKAALIFLRAHTSRVNSLTVFPLEPLWALQWCLNPIFQLGTSCSEAWWPKFNASKSALFSNVSSLFLGQLSAYIWFTQRILTQWPVSETIIF